MEEKNSAALDSWNAIKNADSIALFCENIDTVKSIDLWSQLIGDPHISTRDNLHFDCPVKGELVLARSLNSSFEIQGRFQEFFGFATVSTASVTKGIAIRLKDPNLIVQVSLANRNGAASTVNDCPVELIWINRFLLYKAD